MQRKTPLIGIIGAMEIETEGLRAQMTDTTEERVSGIRFTKGLLEGLPVVCATCGVGKVAAALCAEAMILRFGVTALLNTGVAGGLDKSLKCADIVVADKLCQHDMDTSPLGDEKGLISGINRVYFESDSEAVDAVILSGYELGITVKRGTIATGDQFIATDSERERIVSEFGAAACEMEGAAIAHAAYVGGTPFAVVRAISDGANEEAMLDFPTFLKMAVKNSEALTLEFIKEF